MLQTFTAEKNFVDKHRHPVYVVVYIGCQHDQQRSDGEASGYATWKKLKSKEILSCVFLSIYYHYYICYYYYY